MRKRNTSHYKLRQFWDLEKSLSRIRPCEVSLENLEVPSEMIETAKNSIQSKEFMRRNDEADSDSVDDLLKSSSDSDSGIDWILWNNKIIFLISRWQK